MKIYTRTGDDGTTGLFGGPRVSKNDLRIEAYGTVDELNSAVGLARAHLTNGASDKMDALLEEVQRLLLVLGADLSTPMEARVDVPRISEEAARDLEFRIDQLEDDLPPLANFILPGGTPAAASLHLARTICRRAERIVTALAEKNSTSRACLIFLNRLSDFLFVAARWINLAENAEEEIWTGS